MVTEWLKKQVSVAEARHCEAIDYQTSDDEWLSFELAQEAWHQCLDQMQEGDELWAFCSPRELWVHLSGRQGIALVRDGKCVAWIVTMMN